jgi:hypothetical protein
MPDRSGAEDVTDACHAVLMAAPAECGGWPRPRGAMSARRGRVRVSADLPCGGDPGSALRVLNRLGQLLDQIAVGARVAVQTVYYTFKTKGALLAEVVEVTAAGENDPVPVFQRPWCRR